MRKSVLGFIAAGALAGCSYSGGEVQSASSTAVEPGTVAMPAADIVSARRTTFFLTTQAVGRIKAGIAEGGDLRQSRAGARMLSRWADTLPKMFPEGSNVDGTRALDTVWTDRAGFEARAAAYRDAANALAATAESGDREATNRAFMTMAGTCHACHQSYRME